MTELINPLEMQIGYKKFLDLRVRQKLANAKYRSVAFYRLTGHYRITVKA
jgi:hypothetical protein